MLDVDRHMRRRNDNPVPRQETKKLLAALHPFPSSFAGEPVFVSGPVTELRFPYECGGGQTRSCGIQFFEVMAFRWLAEGHSKLWHFEAGVESLVEVENSLWLSELTTGQPILCRHPRGIRHFLVYVGDDGAYEVAAKSYKILPNELIDDDRLRLGDST